MSDKFSLQLRLSPDLALQLRTAAEDSGISVNALVQGICTGCLMHVAAVDRRVVSFGKKDEKVWFSVDCSPFRVVRFADDYRR